MSLINEALKRAEEQKLEKSAVVGDAQLLPPVQRRPRLTLSRALTLRLFVGAVLVSATFAAVRVWLLKSKGAPSKAVAAIAAPSVAQAAAGQSASTKPHASQGASADKGHNLAKQAPPAEFRQGANLSIAATQPTAARIKTPPTPASPADQTAPGLATAKPSPDQATTRPTTQPAVGGNAGPAKAGTESGEGHPEQVAGKPEAKGPPPIPSEFKVNSIMVGPNGSMAIINGRVVRTGDKIGEATIVDITRYAVTLDVSGHKLSLGM